MDTLGLLHRWLECDGQAGKQLWFDQGFYFKYQKTAIGIGWRHIREEIRSRGTYVGITKEEMEGYATDAVLEIIDGLKPSNSKKTGKKPGDFKTEAEFRGYLSKSLNRIRDIINKEINRPQPSPIPIGPDSESSSAAGKEEMKVPRGKAAKKSSSSALPELEESSQEGGISEEEEPSARPSGKRPSFEESPMYDVVLGRERKSAAVACLEGFQNHLQGQRRKSSSLEEQLEMLIEAYQGGHTNIPLEEVAEEVIWGVLEIPEESSEETETKEQHRDIRNYFRGKGITDANYDQRNKRLRKKWREFCEREGSGLWRRYLETLK